MNKLTLSIVALSTVGGMAQVHAADLTPEQKADLIAAKKANIAQLRIKLNSASNFIAGKCQDVQDEYLLKLSQIQAELNLIYENDETLTVDTEGYESKIDSVKEAAENAQKPYSVKKALDEDLATLQKNYDNALELFAKYPILGPDRKQKLEDGVNIKALGEKINGYDLKSQDIVAAKPELDLQIGNANNLIQNLTKNIAADEAAASSNDEAYNVVLEAYNDAKVSYDGELQRAFKNLPTPIYATWQSQAVEKLNQQYRELQKAYKDNEQAYADKKAANPAHYNSNLNAIYSAKSEISNIVDYYIGLVEVQETAYAKALAKTKEYQTTLDAITTSLKKHGITACDNSAEAAQKLIDALTGDVESHYKENNVQSFIDDDSYKSQCNKIAAALEVKDKDGHSYTVLVNNAIAYEGMADELTALGNAISEAEKKAKTQSADKQYNAAAYFTSVLEDINVRTSNLKDTIDVKNAHIEAVAYEAEFKTVKSKIEKDLQDNYITTTEASLNDYNTASATVSATSKQLEALKEVVSDPNVTIDGSVNGKTYATRMDEITDQINKITEAIRNAKKRTGANHAKYMHNAAGLTVDNDIDDLKKQYEQNKAAYDLASAHNAASAHISSAESLISEMDNAIADIAENVYGDKFNADVTAEKEKLRSLLESINDEFALAKGAYNPNATLEDAAKIIAELANVSEKLQTLKKGTEEQQGVDDFVAKTEMLKANNDVRIVLEDARKNAITKIQETQEKVLVDGKIVATGAAADYYNKLLTDQLGILSALEGEIVSSYEKETAVADSVKHAGSIENCLSVADKVAEDAPVNETVHTKQTDAIASLQERWQKAYDTISEGDLSDEAKIYLTELAAEQEKINALGDNVEKAFGNGQSNGEDAVIAAANKEIWNTIEEIQQKSKDNYNDNVAKTNAAQHNKFVSAYSTAYNKFVQAVDILNKFAGIKNSASQVAMEKLLETHDEIYAYAAKLRNLNSEENAKYGEYTSPAYGDEGSIYSSEKFVDTATLYESEIDTKLKAYQDAVNYEAYKDFKSVVSNAESLLESYQNQVKYYLYNGHATAFKDVEDVVINAKKAGATATSNGVPVERMYAVEVDKWSETIGEENCQSMLEADLLKACDAEKSFLVTTVVSVYNSEVKEINSFMLDDSKRQGYLDEIMRLKSDVDLAAKDYDHTTAGVSSIRSAYDAYMGTDSDLTHSDAYQLAANSSKNSEANIAAYDAIVNCLDSVQAEFDKVLADVKPLMVSHQVGDVTITANSLKSVISNRKAEAEKWKSIGDCVNGLKLVEAQFTGKGNPFAAELENLKTIAIDNEIVQLGMKTDEVKEQYNQIAKEDLGLVEDYDATIEELYTKLLVDVSHPQSAASKASIEYRWNNNKLTFANAKTELLAHEAKVADMLNEIVEIIKEYGDSVKADAESAVNEKIGAVDRAIVQAEEWAAFNDATKAEYGAYVEALRKELASVESDFEAKKNSILFYEDGLSYDIAQLQNRIPGTNSELEKFYKKHFANDAAKKSLDTEIENVKTLLSTTYEKVAAYKHRKPNDDKTYEFDYLTDVQNFQISTSVSNLEQTVLASFENVALTANSYKSDIASLRDEIASMDKDASYYEAANWLEDIYNANHEVRAIISGHTYGDTTYAKLMDECDSIYTKYNRASRYNGNVYNGGKSYYDIDGEYFKDEEGNIVRKNIDYLSEAYPAVMARVAELAAAVGQLESDAKSLYYVRGDISGDGRVSVTDYASLLSYILDDVAYADIEEAKRFAADMNGDGEFSVADLNLLSNAIFNIKPSTQVMAKAYGAATGNEISMVKESEEVSVFGKTVKVAVNLANSTAFSAGQFDIQLPEGMRIAAQELTARSNGHELFINEIGNGLYRVVASTIDNNEFNGSNGALVELDIEVGNGVANAGIQLGNAIFADTEGNSYKLTGVDGAGTTGIGSINAATAKERVYSIGGQMMKTVKKGINILVGEDGKSHKVVKK